MASSSNNVTELLHAWSDGDPEALNRLMPLVYDELRGIARGRMRDERADHTLQPTALVHEAYARMVEIRLSYQSRAHFFSMAARTMRRVLVDHARSRARHKRGAGAVRVTLSDPTAHVLAEDPEILDLDRALTRLAEGSSRKARVIELHYFGGLTYKEIAEAMSLSVPTVTRDMRFAKAWLKQALEADPDG